MINKNKLRDTLINLPIAGDLYLSYFVNKLYKIYESGNLYIKTEGHDAIKEMNTLLPVFLSEEQLSDKEFTKKIVKDIIYCIYKFKATPGNYFVFDFMNQDDKLRATYVTDMYRREVLNKICGREKYVELRDKFGFYQSISQYYKRDIISIKEEKDYDDFVAFCQKHSSFIAKPNMGSLGRDTDIFHVQDDTVRMMFDNFVSSGMWIIEELIKQTDSMSQWNPSSVNSIRLNSYITKTGFHVLCPFMRTGRKGSCVDNAGAGGVFAVINEKNGILETDGYDEYGHKYETHPDSGLTFKGWAIPQWEELLKTGEACLRELHKRGHKYIGFDFALTDNGWVLIEGNWGQQVGQICTHKGIKKEFNELMFN